ncbi:predicted protein [Arabidopsis lyrata subsp. lyrata]|uniref:Predicted protein n=1 Tax=Arabidopsis lyrata subsp. lyrata TaxID=81972 RepID=D7MG50_ARALL|nr:predicted protein [Arabidopsis lyrata subsp. lyrata]
MTLKKNLSCATPFTSHGKTYLPLNEDNNQLKEAVDINTEHVSQLSIQNDEQTIDNSGCEVTVDKMNTSVPEKSTEPDEGVDVNNSTCDKGKEEAATEEEKDAMDINAEHISQLSIQNDEQTVDNSGCEAPTSKTGSWLGSPARSKEMCVPLVK